MTQEEYSAVCPYLGLADDADSHATYATEAHRCYRLPNPTRIATPHQEKHCLGANHVTCPVYLGEGVPQAGPASRRGAVAAGAGAVSESALPTPASEAVRGPRAGQRPRTTTEQRPARPAGAGTLGPRPRAGGISMPVATIGLFALAIVVVALAFAIQQLVSDDDNGSISPADTVATAAALNRTRTAQAGGGEQTQPPATTQTQQPPGSRTPGTTQSVTGSRTPTTGTPGAGGRTYTVEPGDTCGSIADEFDVTTQALIAANPSINSECTNLQAGQDIKIP